MKRKIAAFAGVIALWGLLSGAAFPTFNMGKLTIEVATNGQITITIVDGEDTPKTFTGTGIANHVGGFYITCHGPNNKQVTINGSLRGSGLGRTAQGTVAGKIAIPYNADVISSPDATVFTNHFEGHFKQGEAGGNWFGDVDAGGKFAGSLVISESGTTVPITGNVYSNGSFPFKGSNEGTQYEMKGSFGLSQGDAKAKLAKGPGIAVAGTLKGTKEGKTVTGDFMGHNALGE